MTIDIHDSNFDSEISKVLQLTTAGASKTSVTLSIRKVNSEGEEESIDIVLQKAEALVVAETIRIYFEQANN
ncbi:hypothetical protein [Runella limosa]|uniref:hypothetical protein n=1 Tax=Runella limosa TaxID=370978 RepID=UPI00041A5CD5|nr:hypothetical protein [Runella limosa]